VARELGISDTSIHQWRKELAAHGNEAFPGSGHQTTLEEENRRLKRELERTRQERDILKKTISIFSHDQR
jgi:transposase